MIKKGIIPLLYVNFAQNLIPDKSVDDLAKLIKLWFFDKWRDLVLVAR